VDGIEMRREFLIGKSEGKRYLEDLAYKMGGH
jgi:hypothetical protein